MKKIISVMMILILVISMTSVVNAATDSVNINVKANNETVKKGENVTVTVDWGTKMEAVDISLSFDKSKFEFVSSSMSDSYYNVSNGVVLVSWFTADPNSAINKITYTFKAIDEGVAEPFKVSDVILTEGDLNTPTIGNVNSASVEVKSDSVADNQKPEINETPEEPKNPTEDENVGNQQTSGKDENTEKQDNTTTQENTGKEENTGNQEDSIKQENSETQKPATDKNVGSQQNSETQKNSTEKENSNVDDKTSDNKNNNNVNNNSNEETPDLNKKPTVIPQAGNNYFTIIFVVLGAIVVISTVVLIKYNRD